MIKIITEAEAKQLGIRPFGKKHYLRVQIGQLEKGQILHVPRADFTWKKQNPNIFIRPLMKATSKKFEVTYTANKSGWIIKRTE